MMSSGIAEDGLVIQRADGEYFKVSVSDEQALDQMCRTVQDGIAESRSGEAKFLEYVEVGLAWRLASMQDWCKAHVCVMPIH